MSLTLENSNLVWQRVKIALESLEGKPVNAEALKRLKEMLSTVKGNPTLQFVAISDLTGDTVIADAATTLYALFLKKQATATDAYAKLVNHASTAAGTTFAFCFELNATDDEILVIFPAGQAFSTGITAVSSTTDTGGTDSTSGDGPNGFAIIAAAS